jgi:hypothetical protein
MYCRVVILCAAIALLAVCSAPADDKPAPDKPPEKPKGKLAVGSDLPGPFRPYNITGKYEKKFHCLTNDFGLNPTVMIFAQNLDTKNPGALPALLGQLDQYIVDKPKTRLNAFAVFLFNDLDNVVTKDDERGAHADDVLKLRGADKPLQKLVLCLDSAAALKSAGYDLDPAKQVIVVLYDELKVKDIRSCASENDVAAIMKEVKENFAPFKK